MTYNNYMELVKYLKSRLPLSHPIKVKRVNIRKDYDGDCQFKQGIFIIRIQKTLTENSAIDTVIHEFSHVLSWHKEENIHGPIWGKAYSKVYNKFLEWQNEKNNAK